VDPIIIWIIDKEKNEVVASWRAAQAPAAGEGIRVVKDGEGCAEPMNRSGVVVERLWKTTTTYPEAYGWHTKTECYVNVQFQ
jgi:hypothetical protein